MREVQSIFYFVDVKLNSSKLKLLSCFKRRHSFRLMLASVTMLLMITSIHAEPIDVDGVTVEIPSPKGFTAITPKMTAIYDFQTKLWPETAVHFLTFIQDDEIQIALRNEIPDMNRRMAVTALRELAGKTVQSSDFLEMKTYLKTQNENLTKQVQKAAPEENEKLNNRLFGDFGASVKVDIPQTVFYPLHDDSERSFAFSLLNSYTLVTVDGKQAFNTVSVTSTYLHVRGKLLLLFAYGEKDELSWTRATSKKWADSILAANPPM